MWLKNAVVAPKAQMGYRGSVGVQMVGCVCYGSVYWVASGAGLYDREPCQDLVRKHGRCVILGFTACDLIVAQNFSQPWAF